MDSTGKSPGHILWAVDVFETPRALLERAAEALCALTAAYGAEITPVYVGSPPWHVSGKAFARRMAEAESLLIERMGHFACPRMEPPRVLPSAALGGAGRGVSALLEHAEIRHADLITTTTRGREGPLRWFGGSFAETLVHRAALPLLVVGPYVRAVEGLSPIVFVVGDLGDDDSAPDVDFERVLRFASATAAPIVVFHAIASDETFTVSKAPGGGRYGRSPLSDKRRHLARWIRRAADLRVELSVETRILRRLTSAAVADAVLETARDRRAGVVMIGGAAETSGASWQPSVALRLIRRAELPVWIIRAAPRPDAGELRAS